MVSLNVLLPVSVICWSTLKTPSLAIPPLAFQPSTSLASSHHLPHSAHVIIVLPQLSSDASTRAVERYRLSTNDQPDYRVICAPVIVCQRAQFNMRNRHPFTLHLDQHRATVASTSTASTQSKIISTFLQFLPFSKETSEFDDGKGGR